MKAHKTDMYAAWARDAGISGFEHWDPKNREKMRQKAIKDWNKKNRDKMEKHNNSVTSR